VNIGSLADSRLRDADEEVEMPGAPRSAAGPADNKKLAGLIEPVVCAAGMDMETVRVTVAGRRRLVRVVVDSDHGVSLDDAADISREISAVLDAANPLGEMPYTLEVSSPGVDRPLTEPRHWRRATGRLVKVKSASSGNEVEGRVIAADPDGVTLNVKGAMRRFGYADLGPGAIQLEFGRMPDSELEEFDDPEAPDEPESELGEDFTDEFFNDKFFNDEAPEYEADTGAGGDGH
jgi:ribosome maturation factor RimP